MSPNLRPDCDHSIIVRWRPEPRDLNDDKVRIWACQDCQLRFYPHGEVTRGLGEDERRNVVASEWLAPR